MMRELSANPKHRRIFLTDAKSPYATALAKALLKAGAAEIYAGEPENWRPHPNIAVLRDLGVEILPMDVTDVASVGKMAGEIGGKTDILINTAQFMRPGGILSRGDTGFAREELEIN